MCAGNLRNQKLPSLRSTVLHLPIPSSLRCHNYQTPLRRCPHYHNPHRQSRAQESIGWLGRLYPRRGWSAGTSLLQRYCHTHLSTSQSKYAQSYGCTLMSPACRLRKKSLQSNPHQQSNCRCWPASKLGWQQDLRLKRSWHRDKSSCLQAPQWKAHQVRSYPRP